MNVSANVLDRRIRRAIDAKTLTSNEARIVRILFSLLPEGFATFDTVVKAARILEPKVTPHQLRTNYRAAGITYDLVHQAINA